eukprot:gene4966-9937_t
MKLKHLEAALSDVDVFDDPKIHLEQIPTSPHIAAHMIYSAQQDIENLNVGDFGCGTGMLSIASSYMRSAHVIGIDVDSEALDTAWVNISKLEISDIDLVQCDIQNLSLSNDFDTIVMNPPFGTRNVGIDTAFVNKAMEHFVRLATDKGWNIEVIAELRYDIPKTFKYHKEKTKDIEVDLYRFKNIS